MDFNSHDFSLRQFDRGQAAVTQLAAIIEQGLSAKEWVMLTVEAQVRLGAGQEVFRRRSWYSTATVVKVACYTGGRHCRYSLSEDWQCFTYH